MFPHDPRTIMALFFNWHGMQTEDQQFTKQPHKAYRINLSLKTFSIRIPDPLHFGVDPDPRIRASD